MSLGLDPRYWRFNRCGLRRGLVDEGFAGGLGQLGGRYGLTDRGKRFLRLRRKGAQRLCQLLGLLGGLWLGIRRLGYRRLRGREGRRFIFHRLVHDFFGAKQALQKPWPRTRGFAVRLQVVQRLTLQAAQFAEQQGNLARLADSAV